MNSTENHKCPLLASLPADFIAAQCVAGVNSNSHNVAGRNACDIQLFQGFINDYRIAEAGGCRSGEHIEPAWRDDANAKGLVTRIDEINFHCHSSGAALLPLRLPSVGILSPKRSRFYSMSSLRSIDAIRWDEKAGLRTGCCTLPSYRRVQGTDKKEIFATID